MKNDRGSTPVSVFRWIWHSFLRTALIPLVLIELGFIGIYFGANNWSQKEMIRSMMEESTSRIANIAMQEANTIQQEIQSVANATNLYRKQAEKALKTDAALSPGYEERLAYSPEGMYTTIRDSREGGVAVFYSGYSDIGEKERMKAARALALEGVMKDIIATEPLSASIYFNSFDSLNVIYPYFDVRSQYPAKMNIPEYNFYYEADNRHNPERKVVWTDAYLDPAGHGWMASSIAPVYNGDFLEGVVGVDVTVGTIADQILQLNIPWEGYGVLIGKEGTILALPQKGEADWGLNEVTDHDYAQAIMQDTFKPDAFNLYKRESLSEFAHEVMKSQSGASSIALNGSQKAVSWSTVPSTGWKLLVIVPESNIYSTIEQLKASLFRIGTYMIAGLIVFYTVFFSILALNSKRMSTRVSKPLVDINAMVQNIGSGNYYQEAPIFPVIEFSETADHIVRMGSQLGEANMRLVESQKAAEAANEMKSQFIANMSHEIRTPMNAVLGYTALLKNSVSDEQGLKYIETIQRAGNALIGILSDILDISKIEAGKLDIQTAPVDIRNLLLDMRNLFSFDVLNKELSLDIRVAPEVPEVVVIDDVRVRQILFNLIGNAVKFTVKGYVEIAVMSEDSGSSDDSISLTFEVRDTGLGISPEQQEAIFEPFKQQDGQSTKKYGGTGLGLSIARRLVQLMGGEMALSSTLGQGSVFRFTVPSGRVPSANAGIGGGQEMPFHMERADDIAMGLNLGDAFPEDITEELVDAMAIILDGIWQECSKNYRINDVKELAKQLEQLSRQFTSDTLAAYAASLEEAARTFNSKNIRSLVARYPKIVEAVRSKLK